MPRRGFVKGQPQRFILGHVGKTKSPAPIADRFWPRVNKTDGCWLWTGHTLFSYGRFNMTPVGKSRQYPQLAHRVAWELTHGAIPDGLCVLHRCDNPPCVRPDHLFLGTIDDNNKDAARKGRFSTPAHQEAGRKNLVKATAMRLQYRRPYSPERLASARATLTQNRANYRARLEQQLAQEKEQVAS